jgi:hypothetical protein
VDQSQETALHGLFASSQESGWFSRKMRVYITQYLVRGSPPLMQHNELIEGEKYGDSLDMNTIVN